MRENRRNKDISGSLGELNGSIAGLGIVLILDGKEWVQVNSLFEELIALIYIEKQVLLDVSALLSGNVTVVLIAMIALLSSLGGVVWDLESILEEIILLLSS